MSEQEKNSSVRDNDRRSFDDDSDDEGGGIKPAYSIEDLVVEAEEVDEEEEKKMTSNRSNASLRDSALDVDRDNYCEAGNAKSGESSKKCRGADDSGDVKSVSKCLDAFSVYLDDSFGRELPRAAKKEDEKVCANSATILERGSGTSFKTVSDDVAEEEKKEEEKEEKEEDEGQKGGTLVPGQHLSRDYAPNELDENTSNEQNTSTRVANSEDDGGISSEFDEDEDSGGQSQQSQESLTQVGNGSSGSVKITRSTLSRSNMLEKFAGRLSQKFQRDSDTETSEDSGVLEVSLNHTKHPPPQLPPAPDGLSSQQLQRRHIVNAIIESEKSYSASLIRLIEDYEKPLLEAKPQIVPREAVRRIFYKIRDILQCHNMFHIELSAMADNWDAEEKIGDVFTASFSKSLVFDVYKAFVVNFSAAFETVKKQARRQTAFAEFIKQKLETSEDRLSLFGLLVKPVQRFPQFMMMLQDLLRCTPKDHHDRLSLQLALSELESLTDQLNEAKRDSESRLEVRRLLDNLSVFGSALLKVDEESSLLVRQDDVIEIKQKNGEPQERQRRLFLLSDQLICAEVYKRDSIGTEKFTFHWSIPIKEVEVIESVLPSSYPISVTPGKTQISPKNSDVTYSPSETNPYKRELDDMIHDLTVFQSMVQLSDQLRLSYCCGYDRDMLRVHARSLQAKIRQKCNIEHSLVTLSLPTRSLQVSTEKLLKEQVTKHIGKVGRSKSLPEEIRLQFTFQFGSMAVKLDWLQELQDAKLSTDPSCHPGWHTSESNQPLYRSPHFHPPLLLDITKDESKKLPKWKKKSKDMVYCATCVTIPSADDLGLDLGLPHLWVCNGDQSKSQVTVVSLNSNQPCIVESFKVCDSNISSVESVPATGGTTGDQVWMATEDKKIIICEVVENDRSKKRQTASTDSVVTCMKYLDAKVFAGMKNGTVLVFCFNDGDWNLRKPLKQTLGSNKVSCLLPVNHEMWVSSNLTIHKLMVSASSQVISKKESHDLSSDFGQIECMVKAGVGLLVAFSNRAVIRLYHMETLQHLQDINIASAVTPLLEGKQLVSPFSEDRKLFALNITSLLSGNGLLWVGTNYGFILTLPLPRLEGVPQVKRRPAVSYHAQGGPVRFLASVHCASAKPVTISSSQQTDANTKLLENIEKKTVLGNDELAPVRRQDKKDADEDEPTASEEGVVDEDGSLIMQNQWNSTPDLRSLNDSDVGIMYESLLKGVDAEMDSQLLQSLLRRNRLKGAIFSPNFNSAVSDRMSQLTKSVRRTFSSVQSGNSSAKFYRAVADDSTSNDSGGNFDPVVEETSESTLEVAPDETRSDDAKDVPVTRECEADESVSDSKSTDEKQIVDHSVVKDSSASSNSGVVLPGVARRVAHSRRFVVVSGGEGFVNWKEKKPFDKSHEDICLLHWKC